MAKINEIMKMKVMKIEERRRKWRHREILMKRETGINGGWRPKARRHAGRSKTESGESSTKPAEK